MKYCPNCGKQLTDDAQFCPTCGALADYNNQVQPTRQGQQSGLKTATKIFMVIGCVASALYFLIPLCWTIPMTVTYFNKVNQRQPISTGFKICSLLFVNTIAGILMLCDNNN